MVFARSTVALAAAFFCLPVFAVDTTSVLDPVQVTATRLPESVNLVPATVSVVSGKELRARGANDLRTALSLVSGVEIAPGGDAGPAGSVPAFYGFREFDAFLLVVDGVPAGGAFNPTLSTLDLRLDGRLAVACITLDDLEETGAAEADSDGVIDQLRAIVGVQVAAVIREPRAGGGALKKVSLRSAQPDVDVARIAHAGGGGGHAMAAGFAMEGSFADVIALIEAAFAGV